jgi:hypothetical protein
MTLSISHHPPGVRLGVDECPGIAERGHGLTMTIIHDASCCHEWETGQASAPARAQAFCQAAGRWGATWPGGPQHPGPRIQAGAEPEAGT